MPRRSSKGPRLWLQKGRDRADGYVEQAVWVILDDGNTKRRTGCAEDDRSGAEQALASYIAEKRIKDQPRQRGADQILIADVLTLYLREKAPTQSRPREVTARVMQLDAWWGDRRLSDITGQTCREYAASRTSLAAARRELEDLRAAIQYHLMEGYCREVVKVVLPEKSPPRELWATRQEIAKLIWIAWRHREVQKGKETDRRPWRHVARFIILAVYTGTRAGAVCSAAFKKGIDGAGWIDLDHALFYRRPIGERETKKRRPPAPLPPRLMSHLTRWARSQSFAIEFNGSRVADVDKAFAKVAEAAGLPDITPHVLRHTAATWLMQAGTDEWEAAGYLGMTAETLHRNYAHHSPHYLKGAVSAMQNSRGKKSEKNKRTEVNTNATKAVNIGGNVWKIQPKSK